MRATSSSSAISRLSRSASALTVASISFFCSSLSLSQRFSSACTKPFTPVSGERISWATVATRSERSRSSRARPRPERSVTATRSTGSLVVGRWIRAVTSTSCPLGSVQACSGTPVRVESPRYGALWRAPGVAVLVLEQQHRLERGADVAAAEHRAGGAVQLDDDAVAVGDHHPVGQCVEDPQFTHARNLSRGSPRAR